jgi:hypothetical protein
MGHTLSTRCACNAAVSCLVLQGGPPPGRGGSSGPQGPGGPAIQQVSLDKVVSDIVAMGFSHGQVSSTDLCSCRFLVQLDPK